MKRYKWSPPAIEPSEAGDSSDASGPSRPVQKGGSYFAVHFIFCMVFWGLIGSLFSSWFPIGLGAFFFFTDDEFIEWVLQKVGIQLVPDALGPEFIKVFVFIAGLAALLAFWSAPKWLSPRVPSGNAPWSALAAAALLGR